MGCQNPLCTGFSWHRIMQHVCWPVLDILNTFLRSYSHYTGYQLNIGYSTRYWSLCFNASNVNIHDPIWVTFSGFIYQQGVWGLPVIHWLSLSTSQGTLMGNKHLLVLLLIYGISCLVVCESVNCLALLSLSWKPICSECVLNSRPNIISNCIHIHISIHIFLFCFLCISILFNFIIIFLSVTYMCNMYRVYIIFLTCLLYSA